MKNEEVDKKIGMPDVDAEWKRFRKEVIMAPSNVHSGMSLHKIAAILVVALMLTGLGYAAVRTSFFTQGWNEDVEQATEETSTANANQNTPHLGEVVKGAGQLDSLVLFNDVCLDSIMMHINQYYKVESRFADDNLRSVRLLFKWNRQHSLDEVLQRLNGFERFQIRREENNLIVEQPQAKQ